MMYLPDLFALQAIMAPPLQRPLSVPYPVPVSHMREGKSSKAGLESRSTVEVNKILREPHGASGVGS